MAEAEDGPPLLDQLKEDDVYQQFFSQDFDASRLANSIIQAGSIAGSLDKLSDAVGSLETELYKQVVSRHDDLLVQATGIQKLEDVLKMVSTRVSALSKSFERIQEKVSVPYQSIVTRTKQLMRLQSACEILRRTLRYLYLAKRLNGQLRGGAREISKAAATLTELNELTEVVDLRGVDAVDAEAQWISEAQSQINKSAQEMLVVSMDTQNQTQLGTALQVFRNLNRLQETVRKLVDESLAQTEQAIGEALDHTTLADSGTAAVGSSSDAARRATLWTRIESLLNKFLNMVVRIRHLERVLVKKKDVTTQVRFLDDVLPEGDASLVEQFWTSATNYLKTEFARISAASSFVKDSFVGEYPKLLRLFKEACTRISASTNVDALVSVHQNNSESSMLLRTVSQFEIEFLARSLERMFDPVRLVFPDRGRLPPSVDEVVNICKTVATELSISNVDNGFAVKIARNVAKTIQLYGTKSELMISTGPSALQLSGTCSQEMLRNIAISNRLDQLCKGMEAIMNAPSHAHLPEDAIDLIEAGRQHALTLLGNIIEPICSALSRQLEDCILQIHDEDFALPESPTDQGTSGSTYITNLQQQSTLSQREVLSRVTCKDVVIPRVKKMLHRLTEMFVRHCCLIRNFGEQGKLRLAADMSEFELAMEPFECRLSDLGPMYRRLRALRPLLFLDVGGISENPAVGEVFPISLVVHHLYSYASEEELQPPNVMQGLGFDEYSAWLDRHSEAEIVKVIQESLDAYAVSAGDKGATQFDPLYPVLTELCARGH